MTAVTDRVAVLGTDVTGLAPVVPLGGTGRVLWSGALLRSSGFPSTGLEVLAGPAAARAADAHLAGDLGREEFVVAYEADSALGSAELARLAGDEDVRRAVAWQNRSMAGVLTSLTADRPVSPAKRRERERALALYWQRYCTKAETIGFFGPVAWIDVVADAVHGFDAGPTVTARTRVGVEHWVVSELARWAGDLPGARWWFPPRLRPDVHLDAAGSRLLVPGRPPLRLDPDTVLVLRHSDGERSGEDVLERCALDRSCSPGDLRPRVEKVLAGLRRRRLLLQDGNVAVDADPLVTLRRRFSRIGDPELHARVGGVLAQVEVARDRIAAADLHPDAGAELDAALRHLDEVFSRSTGTAASREGGKAYAARATAYQDATRDVRLTLGRGFHDRLAAPLDLVARSADWFVDLLAGEVEAALHRDVLAAGRPVTLADLWPKVLGYLWGEDPAPLTAARAELSRRWTGVLATVPVAADDPSRRWTSSAALRDAVERAFPAPRADRVRPDAVVENPHLGIHSPDLQLCVDSPQALEAWVCGRGRGLVVLGELHAGLATLDIPCVDWTTAGETARDAVNRHVDASRPRRRLVPLFPEGWPRNTGRVTPTSFGAGDEAIGFTNAPQPRGVRVHAATGIALRPNGSRVLADLPDGTTATVPELLGVLLSMVAADAFKIGLDGPRTPRVTIDDLVLFRETWRLPLDGLAPAAKGDRHRDYLAARAFRHRHGLPERVFVKFAHETKPVFVDFTSPVLVLALSNLVKGARRAGSDPVATFSEALPDPRDAWLRDGRGRRYVSEIRCQTSRTREPTPRPEA